MSQKTVVTDYGLGPDKWATAWLMARHAVPGAKLTVVPQGAPLSDGIAFDVPTSPLRRERDHAAFQSVIEHYKLSDPSLIRMALISLGDPRRMLIRAKAGDRQTIAVDLEPGSLLCMSHASQITHEHGIPKTRKPQGPRISTVFRVRPRE